MYRERERGQGATDIRRLALMLVFLHTVGRAWDAAMTSVATDTAFLQVEK